jgi:hypothetical protein
MKSLVRHRAIAASLVIATLAVGSLASNAHADSGPWFRWKQGYRDPRVIRHASYGPGRVFVRDHDGAAPLLAGFIGGLVLGSAIHPHPVVYAAPPCPPPLPVRVESSYEYYDPDGSQYYSSLEECDNQSDRDYHPRVIEVIDRRTDECVGKYEWHDGGWFRDRGDSRGWQDDRNR